MIWNLYKSLELLGEQNSRLLHGDAVLLVSAKLSRGTKNR